MYVKKGASSRQKVQATRCCGIISRCVGYTASCNRPNSTYVSVHVRVKAAVAIHNALQKDTKLPILYDGRYETKRKKKKLI